MLVKFCKLHLDASDVGLTYIVLNMIAARLISKLLRLDDGDDKRIECDDY